MIPREEIEKGTTGERYFGEVLGQPSFFEEKLNDQI